MRAQRLVPFVVLLAIAAHGVGRGAEGRIPIFAPIVLDATQPDARIDGQYVVTRNISTDAGFVIQVIGTGVERVEIDLNGFNLTRTDNGQVFSADNVKTLVLRNGSMTSPSTAGQVVDISSAPSSGEVVLERLKLSGGGTSMRLFNVPNFQIHDNIIVDSGTNAMVISGDGGLEIGGAIERNVIKNPSRAAIEIGAATPVVLPRGLVVRGNRVAGEERMTSEGIWIKHARNFIVEKNTVNSIARSCIKIQQSSTGSVVGNVVYDCAKKDAVGSAGIRMSDMPASDSIVAENAASWSNGVGILVQGDGNQIERNVFNNNAGGGLVIQGNDNTFGRNTGRSNGGTPTCGVAPIGQCDTPDFCDDGTGNTSFEDNFMPGKC